jgi:hypothetical protein
MSGLPADAGRGGNLLPGRPRLAGVADGVGLADPEDDPQVVAGGQRPEGVQAAALGVGQGQERDLGDSRGAERSG